MTPRTRSQRADSAARFSSTTRPPPSSPLASRGVAAAAPSASSPDPPPSPQRSSSFGSATIPGSSPPSPLQQALEALKNSVSQGHAIRASWEKLTQVYSTLSHPENYYLPNNDRHQGQGRVQVKIQASPPSEPFAFWALRSVSYAHLLLSLEAEFEQPWAECKYQKLITLFGCLKSDTTNIPIHWRLPLFFGVDIFTSKKLFEGLRAWVRAIPEADRDLAVLYPYILQARRDRLQIRLRDEQTPDRLVFADQHFGKNAFGPADVKMAQKLYNGDHAANDAVDAVDTQETIHVEEHFSKSESPSSRPRELLENGINGEEADNEAEHGYSYGAEDHDDDEEDMDVDIAHDQFGRLPPAGLARPTQDGAIFGYGFDGSGGGRTTFSEKNIDPQLFASANDGLPSAAGSSQGRLKKRDRHKDRHKSVPRTPTPDQSSILQDTSAIENGSTPFTTPSKLAATQAAKSLPQPEKDAMAKQLLDESPDLGNSPSEKRRKRAKHNQDTPFSKPAAAEVKTPSDSARSTRQPMRMTPSDKESIAEPEGWLTDGVINTILHLSTSVYDNWCFANSLVTSNGRNNQSTKDLISHVQGGDDSKHLRILLPLNIGNAHWICACVDTETHLAQIIDSMPSYTDFRHVSSIVEKFTSACGIGTCSVIPVSSPLQQNTWDCGVFVIVSSLNLLCGRNVVSSVNAVLWRRILTALAQPETLDPGLARDDAGIDNNAHLTLLDPSESTPNKELPQLPSISDINDDAQTGDLSSYVERRRLLLAAVDHQDTIIRTAFAARLDTAKRLLANLHDAADIFHQILERATHEAARLDSDVIPRLKSELEGARTMLEQMRMWSMRQGTADLRRNMEEQVARVRAELGFWALRRAMVGDALAVMPRVLVALEEDGRNVEDVVRAYEELIGRYVTPTGGEDGCGKSGMVNGGKSPDLIDIASP